MDLSSLRIETLLSKIALVGPFLFKSIKQINTRYKMKKIVKKVLLAGDKFMLEMHLSRPGFTYSAFGPFTKNKERIQKLKKTQEIHEIFIKTNHIKSFLNMIWLMKILKV